MDYYIADSAVFIMGSGIEPHRIITIPSVVNELKSNEAAMRFDLARESGARVEMPEDDLREKVLQTANKTKDCEELSSTDIDILAKALEYKGNSVLLTDDYAVQNVAKVLGLEVKPVAQKKIKDVLVWQKQCTGCRRKFDSGDVCPVCGSPLKKRRKRKI
ncbi:DNA-binding protein [Methanolobus sediminis]|uniref:DNA-binding protein n=1 Tax=Methanolobus sediminis TaxID=3072978 RepID=A0AA51YHW9_9EURY|nr:DNA-binding protein [Methanolobus sediminis]WMW23891.1 DNA-binding protein [Methanolobus sediminis]